MELHGAVQLPSRCPAEDCSGTGFKHVKQTQMHTEYQEIRLQESTGAVDSGASAKAVTAVLLGDLADSCQTGGGSPIALQNGVLTSS